MAESGPVLAVDVGGTKLAAAVVLPSGLVVGTVVRPTPQGAEAGTLFAVLVELARAVLDSVGLPVTGAGVGCGGPMDWPAGVVSPVNIPGWRDFPLVARLAAELGVPVRIHNDAVCAAIAEHWRGAGRGHAAMLGMVVSTGVGGGLVLGDRVVDGASGNAGHVGHIVVDPEGPVCGCGGVGCLEAVARGPAVVAWALAHGWTPGGVPADGRALAADARAGDPVALAAYARAGTMLGRGIASAVAALDVTAVVVGGGFAASGDVLFDPLRAAYAKHAGLPHVRAATILPAALGTETGLLGAAALVLEGGRYWTGPAA
ncbi:MAG TPA: ROK family protein [Mycobacteriales bacterium]